MWAREAGKGAPLKNLTIGLIWLVTRGGGVGGVGQGGGQGGVDGGGTREQCGSNKAFTGSTFWAPVKPNNWSDLAGDEGGEAWGVWARVAGKGA